MFIESHTDLSSLIGEKLIYLGGITTHAVIEEHPPSDVEIVDITDRVISVVMTFTGSDWGIPNLPPRKIRFSLARGAILCGDVKFRRVSNNQLLVFGSPL